MPDIKVKGYSGNEIEYSSVPKVWLSAQESTEETPVLVPFTYGEAVSKTVEELDFSEGDMSVDISEGELVTELTIKRPEELKPENIPAGMYIAGVGPGTFAGGGSDDSTEKYLVRVIDYDGTVLEEKRSTEGDVFSLPDPPTHNGLVFDGWSSPVDIADNAITVPKGDITIGPMYHTASGATEIDIVLTKVTGLTFAFVSSKLTGMTSINWGDGTSGTILNHTYSSYGKYTIKIYGMTAIAAGSTSGGIVASPNHTITVIRFGSTVKSIGNYAFYNCRGLVNVVIPNSVTSIGGWAFQNCYSLSSVTFPNSLTTTGAYLFYYCYGLKSAVIPNSFTNVPQAIFYYCKVLESITIPGSCQSTGYSAFYDCNGLKKVTILSGVTSIAYRSFWNCYSLDSISIPDSVTSTVQQAFYDCYGLRNISISSRIANFANGLFYYCYNLESIIIPDGVTIIEAGALAYCYKLKRVVIPGSVTSIGNNAFTGQYNVREYDFTSHESVPTLGTTVFNNSSQICKILVPAALYDEWIAASNWSTYANYIVAV